MTKGQTFQAPGIFWRGVLIWRNRYAFPMKAPLIVAILRRAGL